VKRWRTRLRPGVQDRAAFVRRLLGQNMIGASSALVRRSAFEEVGARFDPRFKRTYDYEMWVRLALAAPVGFLPGFDSCWRIHPAQATGDLGDLESEYRELVDHLWALIEQRLPELRLRPRSRRRKLASLLLTGTLNAIERGDRRAASHLLRRALAADPSSALDARVPFSLLGLWLGRPGRKTVVHVRALAHSHGIRLRD
jgi:hypothetical protein